MFRAGAEPLRACFACWPLTTSARPRHRALVKDRAGGPDMGDSRAPPGRADSQGAAPQQQATIRKRGRRGGRRRGKRATVEGRIRAALRQRAEALAEGRGNDARRLTTDLEALYPEWRRLRREQHDALLVRWAGKHAVRLEDHETDYRDPGKRKRLRGERASEGAS